jgi:hypothetical protein
MIRDREVSLKQKLKAYDFSTAFLSALTLTGLSLISCSIFNQNKSLYPYQL